MEQKFYVYKWYIKDTKEVFYVGKGTRNRCNQISRRNEVFKDYYYNNDCAVEIIEYFDNEKDAFAKEKELMAYYHSIGQAKASLDEGGKGGCHFVWTEAMREYQSKYNPMKRPEQRERMSKNNPMKDPEVAKRVGLKRGRPVIINNIRYNSATEAAKVFNTSNTLVLGWCNKGYNSYNHFCYFEDEGQKVFEIPTNKYMKKAIYIDGQLFSSVAEGLRFLGKKNTCRGGLDTALKTNRPYCGHIVKYANQQPSQENNQQSILEGSETRE